MLMFFNISQYSGFFTELIKTAKGFFKRFIIAYSNASQLSNTPFDDSKSLGIKSIYHNIGMISKYLYLSTPFFNKGLQNNPVSPLFVSRFLADLSS